jgi:hypothetical protein
MCVCVCVCARVRAIQLQQICVKNKVFLHAKRKHANSHAHSAFDPPYVCHQMVLASSSILWRKTSGEPNVRPMASMLPSGARVMCVGTPLASVKKGLSHKTSPVDVDNLMYLRRATPRMHKTLDVSHMKYDIGRQPHALGH